jgi:hypothetical protein
MQLLICDVVLSSTLNFFVHYRIPVSDVMIHLSSPEIPPFTTGESLPIEELEQLQLCCNAEEQKP